MEEEGGGGGKWAWSRGEEAQEAEQARREERQRRKRQREAELLRSEPGSAVQQGAVRTQWERRLESQAQGFLQQVRGSGWWGRVVGSLNNLNLLTCV